MEANAADKNVMPNEWQYGVAVQRIDFSAGRRWAHNDEYSVHVAFCPWGGIRLEVPAGAGGSEQVQPDET